jgi:oxalate decarboxylase/phosphoglucose isomerase-like protein (cupin superfamily)
MRFFLVSLLFLCSAMAADLDPAILTFKAQEDLRWSGTSKTFQQAVLYGDPAKPGLYIVWAKWPPGTGSRPHYHPNDRYVTVISGTWWVGTGTDYDMSKTVPMKAGSFIKHTAGGIHFDGAKDEEVVLQIVGMGPASSIQASAK